MKKLTIFLAFIACVTAGCNMSKVAGVETKAPSDPKGDVVQAAQKLFALKSLSGTVDATGETAYKKQVQYVAPDRYHVTYRDETGADMEMIMTNTAAYIKSGDSWSKLPGEDSPTPTLRNSFVDEVLKTVSDAQYAGEDTVGGKPALVYTYKFKTLVGSFPATSRMWVSKSTGLPVKTFDEFSEGVVKTRLTIFDTETPVTIDLPSK